MGNGYSIRKRIVEGPGSPGERRRALRWEWVHEAFPEIGSMSVIDLGGTAESWLRTSIRPALVHIVNLEPSSQEPPAPWIREVRADACDLPSQISDGRYDLAYSNAVIEHVGGHSQRMRFATDQFYFKTAEEMAQVFGELPEALERTATIAERCNVRIEPVRNSFPEFEVPAGHTLDS